jgi:hypothetical protein
MRARSRKGAGELIEGSERQAWQESNRMQEAKAYMVER